MDAAVPPVAGGALIVGEVVVAEAVVWGGDVGRAGAVGDQKDGVGDRVKKGDVAEERTPGAEAGDVGVADVVGGRARNAGAVNEAV